MTFGLYKGFHNPGSLCYVNALLQQLFAMPSLSHGLEVVCSSSQDMDDNSEVLVNFKAIEAFFNLFKEYNQNITQSINAIPFCEAVHHCLKSDLDIHQTRDVADFLSDVISIFSKYSSSQHIPNLLDEIRGSLSHTISANEDPMNKKLQHEEQFFYISLSVDKKTCPNLEESLRQYTKLHQFPFKWRDNEGNYISTPMLSSKFTTFATLPSHLIFHLKRFRYDTRKKKKCKTFDRYEFPRLLDMTPFCGYDGTQELTDTAYRLSGLVIHSGKTAYTGHYYSLLRKRGVADKEGGGDEEWVRLDDEEVRPFPHHHIEEVFFGADCVSDKSDKDSDSEDDSDSDSDDSDSDSEDSSSSDDDEERIAGRYDSTYMLVYDRIPPRGEQ